MYLDNRRESISLYLLTTLKVYIHFHLWGRASHSSIECCDYMITLIDDFSRKGWQWKALKKEGISGIELARFKARLQLDVKTAFLREDLDEIIFMYNISCLDATCLIFELDVPQDYHFIYDIVPQ
ncbi:hypothetical protein ACJX0J_024699 [Zea mays]